MWASLAHSFHFGFWVHRYTEIKNDIKNKPTSNKLITLNLESPEKVEKAASQLIKGFFPFREGPGLKRLKLLLRAL